jgi:subtilisin-like proprotein convertase family protein
MAVRLHNPGYDYAKKLIDDRHVVLDDRDAWSEHQPSTRAENEFIAEHGWDAYGRWHLGVDDESRKDTKEHWKFPYGDFKDVHRCAVLSAESRAAQRKYDDIKTAVAHLHGMLEALRASARTS